jgi:hypothetical protein
LTAKPGRRPLDGKVGAIESIPPNVLFVRDLYRQAATFEKVVLRLVPTTLNAAIAPTAINAAINAYSMAVTPDSFLIRFMRVRNRILLDMG